MNLAFLVALRPLPLCTRFVCSNFPRLRPCHHTTPHWRHCAGDSFAAELPCWMCRVITKVNVNNQCTRSPSGPTNRFAPPQRTSLPAKHQALRRPPATRLRTTPARRKLGCGRGHDVLSVRDACLSVLEQALLHARLVHDDFARLAR